MNQDIDEVVKSIYGNDYVDIGAKAHTDAGSNTYDW